MGWKKSIPILIWMVWCVARVSTCVWRSWLEIIPPPPSPCQEIQQVVCQSYAKVSHCCIALDIDVDFYHPHKMWKFAFHQHYIKYRYMIWDSIQMANGWSCNGTRFRMRWKIDVLFNEAKPSWIECRSFTECEILYHCTHHTISHLCCTTPRMLTKLNTIDKNLVPGIRQISSFFFLVAKYSQRATNA